MKPHSSGLAFVGATVSLVTIFASSASPIPLYGTYRQADGLTYGDLSLTAAGYFAGAVTALLVFGRLSSHLGRRPISFLALGLAMAACLVLLNVSGAAHLILARILQGLACGLASSAVVSSMVDNAPASPRWLAATIASSGPMIGLTLGALGSGALVDCGFMPRQLPYLVVMAGLAVCAAWIAASPETVARNPGALASLRPRIALPHATRKLFPVASCTFIATWALGGFYQAFGPAMASDQLGTTSAFIAAAVFSSLMAPGAIGGSLAGRFSPAGAQRVGMVVFCLMLAGVLVSLKIRAIFPFLIASTFAGMAQGTILTGSIRALLTDVQASERAGVFSAIYATSYSGAAIPGLIAGRLSHSLNLLQIATGYGILAAVACVITLLAARNPVRPPALGVSGKPAS